MLEAEERDDESGAGIEGLESRLLSEKGEKGEKEEEEEEEEEEITVLALDTVLLIRNFVAGRTKGE